MEANTLLYPKQLLFVVMTLLSPTAERAAFTDSAMSFQSMAGPQQQDFSQGFPALTSTLDRAFDFNVTYQQWCYVVIHFRGSLSAGQYLVVDNTSLDSVQVFSLGPGGEKSLLYNGGNAVPYEKSRRFVWHTVPLAVNKEDAWYLVGMKAPAQNIRVHFDIRTDEELQAIHARYERLIFIYSGCVGFILIASLLGLILLRQRLLAYYTVYLVAAATWIYAHYGYGFQMFYPAHPAINLVIKPVSSLMAMYCMISMVFLLVSSLPTRPVVGITLRCLQLFAAAVMLLSLGRLLWHYPFHIVLLINVAWQFVLTGSIILLLVVLVSVSIGNTEARLLSAGVSAPLITALFQLLSNSGVVDTPTLNEHGLLGALLFEMLVLAFVIIFQLFQERRDKETVLQELEGQQRHTLQLLINLQDNERRRIAQDLHDSIGPLLAAIKINFHRAMGTQKTEQEIAAIFSRTEAIIDESIGEIRTIAHQLMPRGLSSKGLISLLSDYFKDLEPLYDTVIHFSHQVAVSLPEETQVNVYRMICELVLNAARHGAASSITVAINTSAEDCRIMIRDDGKGFSKQGSAGSALGLASMQRRVAYLKGSFDIDSMAGKGTAVSICIPLFIPGQS